MIWTNTTLRRELKGIVKANPDIADVVLFGSIVRGKEKPTDIDVLVLFKSKIAKNKEYLVRKIVERYGKNIAIISKTISTVIESAFDARESILFEGVSLLSGKSLAEEQGFSSWGMFKYHFEGWTKLKKTKFYYALNGRNGKQGAAERHGCIKLSDQILLVPWSHIEPFRLFLEAWQLLHIYIPVLLPFRLARKDLLESVHRDKWRRR